MKKDKLITLNAELDQDFACSTSHIPVVPITPLIRSAIMLISGDIGMTVVWISSAILYIYIYGYHYSKEKL